MRLNAIDTAYESVLEDIKSLGKHDPDNPSITHIGYEHGLQVAAKYVLTRTGDAELASEIRRLSVQT